MKKIIFMLFSLGLIAALVGCKTTESTNASTTARSSAPVVDDLKPVLYGLFNTTITVGEAFDPMAGVTADDNVDGDITSKITHTTDYDVNTPGTYIIYYTVKDTAGNETVKGRSLVVKDVSVAAKIINPNFETELAPWSHWAGEGGVATSAWEDGVAKIEVQQIGSANYHVQFEQQNITIEEGKFYQITFEAKASVARSIGVLMEDPKNNYYKYGSTVINLTTEWATYTLDVTVNTKTIDSAKLGLMLGKVNDDSKPATIYLDNFTMKVVQPSTDEEAPVISGDAVIITDAGSNFDLKTGLTVSDNQDFSLKVKDIVVVDDGGFDKTVAGEYTVKYKVVDASGNEGTFERVVKVVVMNLVDTEEILNGGFETEEDIENKDLEGATGWVEWHQNWGGEAQVTYSIVDGQLVVNITELGSENQGWTIQLQQNGVGLEKGKTYKLVFDAKASVARDIKAVIKIDTPFFGYAEKIFTLSETLETYSFIFTVSADSNQDLTFAFEMGQFGGIPNASVITFDNIKLLVDEVE